MNVHENSKYSISASITGLVLINCVIKKSILRK